LVQRAGALVCHNSTVQIRDQQVLIRQGGRIVARHTTRREISAVAM
jgi:hypothetical protein